MRFKRIRRILFRLALKGCKQNDPKAEAYARSVMDREGGIIEDEIRMRRALKLEYFLLQLMD